MRKIRVLALMDRDLLPPADAAGRQDRQAAPWRTEYDVLTALRALNYPVCPLGVADDLGEIRRAIDDFRPHIVFNLLEEFHGEAIFDQNVVSYLELLRLPYTGNGPRPLMLARDKALAKKIFAYHRIPVPDFMVVPRGKRVRRPGRLKFPLFVKSLLEEASLGIAQASIVDNDEKLAERVAFIHHRIGTDAIVEQYIEGRELYVGVLGNERLTVLPPWELRFTKAAEDVPRIATAKVKWDLDYQRKQGIVSGRARDLPPGVEDQIARLGKRIYRCLGMSGYARIDLRMTPEGRIFVLEANPNPQLAEGEDFAESARAVGIGYNRLIQLILHLGLLRARS